MMTKLRTEMLKSHTARWVLIGLLSVGFIGAVLTSAPRADDPQEETDKSDASAQNHEGPAGSEVGAMTEKKDIDFSPSKEVEVGDRLSPEGLQKGSPKTTTRPQSAIGKTPVVQVQPVSRTLPKSTSEQNLVNREVYVYKTIGRRDPFASLLEGEFETTVGHPLLDVSSMKLVGVVWGKSDKFALIEDGRGHGHILRVGDPVINGYVVGLTEDELMIRQSSYGESQMVTIQLQRKESGSDAP